MTSPINLSHSARGKFEHCPRMFRLHYLDKIRPAGSTSALLFGSAIDKACENYMLSRNKLAARQIFRDTWNEQEINGVLTQLSESEEVDFHDNDFDHELLLQSDNELITKNTIHASVSALVKAGEDQARIRYAKWTSLFRKGQIILRAFTDWVDENVAEVLGVQVPIELEDEEGNKVPGFADFVIKVHGYDKPILVDLKTTARYYERDSVKKSEQLALYFLYLKNTKFPDMERAAYLVLGKQIKKNRVKTCKVCGHVTTSRHKTCAEEIEGKRCGGEFDEVISPECNLQYIHDEISQEFIDVTVEKFNIAVAKIKTGEFPQCLTGCESYYGRRCPYFQYCHENGNMAGLIKKEQK